MNHEEEKVAEQVCVVLQMGQSHHLDKRLSRIRSQ